MHIVAAGGGISGLACAYRLVQLGHDVTVLERAPRPGGVIETIESSGFQFEMGPQSFLGSDLLINLVRELDLESELLEGDPRAARYILLGGKLVRAPMAPPALLTSPLLSAGTKFRLFTEMFRRTQPPEDDESVAAFVRRKFGADLLDNLVAPLVSGIYAGDPEQLSLRAAFPFVHLAEKRYGSVMKGAMKSAPAKGTPRPGLCSFRRGVGALTAALHQHLGARVRTVATVASLQISDAPAAGPAWTVQLENSAEPLRADAVVLAIPTADAARILQPISAPAAAILEQIEYAPVAVVNTAYNRPQVRHPLDGFGFLVPRKAGLHILGTVWSSSLFPGRAPQGTVSLASFVGGATSPNIVKLAESELAEIVHRENSRVLGIEGAPVATSVRIYSRALPQYNLGHTARIERLRAELAALPRLMLTGNYLTGPSIAACVAQAMQTADALHQAAGLPAACPEQS